MFIPIGTEQSHRRTPYATFALIAATTIISAGLWATGMHTPNGTDYSMVNFTWNPHEWWRLFTYQFAHADGWHLVGNMIFLWVFGPALEDKLGHIAFSLLYLIGGAGAAGVNAIVDKSGIGVIGASGSVATIAGAFVALFPLINIKVVLFFFMIGVYQISARWFVLICILKDVIMPGHNVAWAAHLGGYACGFLVGCFLVLTKIVPRDQFDCVALMQRMRRRAEFRAAAAGMRNDVPADSRLMSAVAKPFRKESKDLVAESHARAATLRASVSSRMAAGKWKEAGVEYVELLGLAGLAPAVRALPRDRQMELCGGLMQAGEYRAAHAALNAFGAAYPHEPDTFAAAAMSAMIQVRHLGEADAAKAKLTELRKQASDQEQTATIDGLLAEAVQASGKPV